MTPSELSMLKSFASKQEDRMARIIKRVSQSDGVGATQEARANSLMNDHDRLSTAIDTQLDAIEEFNKSMEQSLGNLPPPSAAPPPTEPPAVHLPPRPDMAG